jgi:hypothetical protein
MGRFHKDWEHPGTSNKRYLVILQLKDVDDDAFQLEPNIGFIFASA